MKVNMGSIDRIVRTFVVTPIANNRRHRRRGGSVAGIVLLALAAVMLATSVVGFCPLYTLVGLDTRSLRKSRHAHSA